jgi:hypothetical protein
MVRCRANCVNRGYGKYRRVATSYQENGHYKECYALNDHMELEGACHADPSFDRNARCTNFEDWDRSQEIKDGLARTERMRERNRVKGEFMRFLGTEQAAKIVMKG